MIRSIYNSELYQKYFSGFPIAFIKSYSNARGPCEYRGEKARYQNLIDAELSTHVHRWKRMRENQRKFFEAMGDLILNKEADILKLLKLPSMDKILQSYDSDFQDPGGKFEINPDQWGRYKIIVGEIQKGLLGKDTISKDAGTTGVSKIFAGFKQLGDDIPIVDYFMYNSFNISLDEIFDDIMDNLPGWADADAISRTEIIAQLENYYLKLAIDNAGNRITSKLATDNIAGVYDALMDMISKNKSPYDVGRYLHNQMGGELWYWRRIARSESVLAQNSAFFAQARASQIVYQRWSTSGNPCEVCAALDGKLWELGSGPVPCVLGDCKIMTIDNWKRIKDIKVNDIVLTHTGKFKRVTKLFKHHEKKQGMIVVHYKNIPYAEKRKVNDGIKLELTPNHPVYVEGKWIPAGDLKAGDKIRVLATRCPVCNKQIPYSRWRNNRGDKANYCSLKCSGKVMDNWVHRPKEDTAQIRKRISDFKKENNPMFIKEHRNKMGQSQKVRLAKPGAREKQSQAISKFHKDNPGAMKQALKIWREANPIKYNEIKKRQGETLKRFFFNNPEKHPNCKMKNVSKPQKALFELIKQYYEEAILNMPIKTNCGTRFGDVVLPQNGIIIEYDGEYWHQDKDKELQRDLELQFSGWTVLHFDKDNWQSAPDQINRLLKNHNDEYEFIDIEIEKVGRKTKTGVTLYNLDVDEDHSYIAKGIIVHNCSDTHPHCQCVLEGRYTEGGEPIQDRWEFESPYGAGHGWNQDRLDFMTSSFRH